MDIPIVEQFISGIVNKYVVSYTNVGINGFVFDVRAQEEATVEAEATDHYVEANYAIQDHVAHRPATITLKGFIGELKNTEINVGLGVLTGLQSLGDIGGIAPNFAQQASQVYSKVEDVVSTVDSYINQANNLSNIFNNAATSADAQQNAFDQLSAFCQNNILCTVSTPFGIFKDMLITRLGAIQRDDTQIISDFTVTLKQIRTAQTIEETSLVFSGRAYDGFSSAVNKGQVVGVQISDNSILAGIAS